jgi:hypothetical protein
MSACPEGGDWTSVTEASGALASLRLRLGGERTDDEYPDKPPRMRWATYNRLMDRLVAADGVADVLAARLLGKIGPVQAGGSAL